eukprot:jgi/Picre1/33705/NNA_001184.t1
MGISIQGFGRKSDFMRAGYQLRRVVSIQNSSYRFSRFTSMIGAKRSVTEREGEEFMPPPPRPEQGTTVWEIESAYSPLEAPRRIFCNRSLNMGSIKAVGFDMDYTLASYKPETFETLAHEQTVDKLVKHLDIPRHVLDLTFDYRYMTRGL